MLIAGALDFVVFLRKTNAYSEGGRMVRAIESIREVTGHDGRVLSSEVFAMGSDGNAVAHAPIECIDELEAVGYAPALHGRWVSS
jgi:hypothetical protein